MVLLATTAVLLVAAAVGTAVSTVTVILV